MGSQIPQRIALDDRVDHGPFRELGRRVVRSPVIVDKMQRLRRRSYSLCRDHRGQENGDDCEPNLGAHEPSPR